MQAPVQGACSRERAGAEAVIARAGPETVTVSVGARGKRARNYRQTGSERACGAWAITSRDANP